MLYGCAPVKWDGIPIDLRGQHAWFEVKPSTLGKRANNGVYAKIPIPQGTALCYGGTLVPSIKKYPEFDDAAYAMEWDEVGTNIGIPYNPLTGIGYFAPVVNEPRQLTKADVAWSDLPKEEKSNCVLGSNDQGMYLVICCDIG